jgi:UDP-N-acetylmuramoyl-tripeptide--D-alanyl-D-alanine ligase
MGLTRTIREKLKPIHDVFIAEMGAYKIGDIKVLANFIRPKFGVITSIGLAHLESFGSIENIQQGKFELVESLGENGTAILNRDDKMQREYVIKNRCHVKWYGINEDADVMASDIKLSSKGTTFTLHIKRDPLIYDITTKLLGEHNVYNILAAITIGVEMGMKVKDLVNAIRYVEPVEHRLSIKKHGHITYIDDAFNSNPVGSKKALEVLDKMPGKKIIVTPGMIELGELQYQLNKEFGEFMSEVCDKIILVGEQQTKPIQDGIKEKGYAEDDLYVVNDVKDAFAIINNLDKEDTYVLLENDLPDLFNE